MSPTSFASNRRVAALLLLTTVLTFALLGNIAIQGLLFGGFLYETPEEVSLLQSNFKLHKGDAISKDTKHSLDHDSVSRQGKTNADVFKSMWYPLSGSFSGRIVVQLIFGILYYFLVVAQYPELDPRWGKVIGAGGPNDAARTLQRECELFAIFSVSFPNNLFSLCCSGPRAAQTFHATGIMNYWFGLIMMSCFPCCTLCYTNACTDLNEKLGGTTRGCFMSMLCAWLCFCCVIAQDAECLDLVTDCKTGLCGVELPKYYQWPSRV